MAIILNEDNLLQKCNSQNTRLINYFQRVDVLRRLLEYMTGQIEGEDNKGGSSTHMSLQKLSSVKYS